MHYKKLIEAHRFFYGGYEYRAPYYDEYMESKDRQEWATDSLSLEEIEKLFSFIRKWDFHFKGDSNAFQKIYKYIFPTIKEFEQKAIEDTDLSDKELRKKISDIFDRVADCPGTGRYESTDASKILHTILPRFFVMWDDRIKEGMVRGGYFGAVYANIFLPQVQEELEEAIKKCMDEMQQSRQDAIKYICAQCDGKTLAKLADEYNYMKYTKRHPSL